MGLLNVNKPRDSDIHTLADFAEILCIYQIDEICSRDMIADQIKDNGGTKPNDLALDDCFKQLEWRKSAFGTSYPFNLDQHSRELRFVGVDGLSRIQKIYLSLLYCANLPLITAKDKNPLTDFFEIIALKALLQSWPVMGQVKSFGKSQSAYSGKKWERLNILASEIGGKGLYSDQSFRTKDSGDGGVDLVGWVDLDCYEKNNILSLLAQCACSRDDWPKKQNEISKSRLSLIHASHPWAEVLFSPVCFRDNHGKWCIEGDVGQIIFYDRLRILKLLKRVFFDGKLVFPTLIDQLLIEKADLV